MAFGSGSSSPFLAEICETSEPASETTSSALIPISVPVSALSPVSPVLPVPSVPSTPTSTTSSFFSAEVHKIVTNLAYATQTNTENIANLNANMKVLGDNMNMLYGQQRQTFQVLLGLNSYVGNINQRLTHLEQKFDGSSCSSGNTLKLSKGRTVAALQQKPLGKEVKKITKKKAPKKSNNTSKKSKGGALTKALGPPMPSMTMMPRIPPVPQISQIPPQMQVRSHTFTTSFQTPDSSIWETRTQISNSATNRLAFPFILDAPPPLTPLTDPVTGGDLFDTLHEVDFLHDVVDVVGVNGDLSQGMEESNLGSPLPALSSVLGGIEEQEVKQEVKEVTQQQPTNLDMCDLPNDILLDMGASFDYPRKNIPLVDSNKKATSQLYHTSSTLHFLQNPLPSDCPKQSQLSECTDENKMHVLLLMCIAMIGDTSISHFTYHYLKRGIFGFYPYLLLDMMNKFASRHYQMKLSKVHDLQEYLETLASTEVDGTDRVKHYGCVFQEVSPCDVVHRGKHASLESKKRDVKHDTYLKNLAKCMILVPEDEILKIPAHCFVECEQLLSKWDVKGLRQVLPPRRFLSSQKDLLLSQKQLLFDKKNQKDFPHMRSLHQILRSNIRNFVTVIPYPTCYQALVHPEVDYIGLFQSRIFKKLKIQVPTDVWSKVHFTYKGTALMQFPVTSYDVLFKAVYDEHWLVNCRVVRPKANKVNVVDKTLGKKRKRHVK